MKEKFSCKRCGACCKKFGSEDRNYLPLYDWEIEEFRLLAKQKIKPAIKLDIRPINSFYDLKTKKLFSVIYGLFESPCPFYSEKIGCKIYNKRPFVCRTFPLFWTPKTVPDKIFGINCFGYCRKFDHYLFLKKLTKEPLTPKKISRKVYSYYGESYEFCINSNKVNLYLTNLIKKLEENKIIFAKKIDLRNTKNNPLPFLKFLIENKILSKKKLEQLINNFNKLKYKND